MSQAQISLPPKLVPVFLGKYRYRGAYGGRGSAKSRSFATMMAVDALREPGIYVCAREFQNSLKDSSFAEVKRAIQECWLYDYYDIGREYIRSRTGSDFLFCGLRYNVDSIKSISGIRRLWVDEAENVSENSWQTVIPTIREPGSEIWATWNPRLRNSATNQRFRESPPANSNIVQLNYEDNPWFSAELEAERLDDLAKRPVSYNHIWNGAYLESTETHPFLSYTLQPSPSIDVMALDRVVSIDHSQCVGLDNFVIAETGRDCDGNTHILDLYITNTATIQERLEAVASFVRRRRPRMLVCEDTSESRTFIDVLTLYLQQQDIGMQVEAPTAASRGNKNDYIASWLVPLLQNHTLFCNVVDKFDIIHTEMYNFSMDSRDNQDDILDTLTSGIRFLRTPDRAKPVVFADTGIPEIDKQRRILRAALSGKKRGTMENFT